MCHSLSILEKCLLAFFYFNIESAGVIAVAAAVRDEIHGLFTEFFTGDSLAADYIICYLVSRV